MAADAIGLKKKIHAGERVIGVGVPVTIARDRFKAILDKGDPGTGGAVYDLLTEAKDWYAKAESIRPPGNDDALLRWNACGRIIMRNKLSPRVEEKVELPLE